MSKSLGIYVHIPFCVRKCAYCDFLSAPASGEVRERYVEALLREIRQAKESLRGYETATVFFGGGTPSILPAREIGRILEELSVTVPFGADTEITVECNPGTLTGEKLRSYRSAGVNRLSMGLQSADNRELRMLGRIHTWEEFLDNYLLARKTGFDNLNVDLMSALPGQTREGWLRTLEKTAELEPEHISAYSLMIEEGTPFYDRYREGAPGERELPGEDADRQMYEDTKRFLGEKGYIRYEISNYAKPGFACRHNLSYWRRTDYRGFGIGAASLLEQVRFQNSPDLQSYLRGQFSWESRQPLSSGEQLEETMFLGLRTSEGVELTEKIRSIYGEVIEKLKNQGFLEERENRVCLTDRGIDVSNRVLAEFLLEDER